MRNFIIIFLIVFLSACSTKNALNYEPNKNFKDENETFRLEKNWYKLYNQVQLNELVEEVLKNNIDFKIASLNLARAYENAGLISADLFPTLSAGADFTTNRDISANDNFRKKYQAKVGVNYEVDLLGKILSRKYASDWLATADEFDLQSLKLTLINSAISGYFKEIYLNEALNFTERNIKSYEKLNEIINIKVAYGKSEPLELKQTENALLNLQNKKLSLISQLKNNELFLRNLLGNDSEFLTPVSQIENIKFLGVDMSVPYIALSNRPDLRAAISRINASFYDYRVSQLEFFPNVSLGTSLSSNDEKFKDAFKLNFFGGNVSINLPFLDYPRLKSRLRISQIDFEINVKKYEKALSEAANEVRNLYEIYEISLNNLQNLKKNYENAAKITEIYRAKYDAGRVELKDYLEADTAAIDAKISLISQYYTVLETENRIYKSISAKFYKK